MEGVGHQDFNKTMLFTIPVPLLETTPKGSCINYVTHVGGREGSPPRVTWCDMEEGGVDMGMTYFLNKEHSQK